MAKIALLGWGSVVWSPGSLVSHVHMRQFEDGEEAWYEGGPPLPLEFSRISRSRKDMLTLVLDPVHGTRFPTSYAISSRNAPEDAISDLCLRERLVGSRVGFYIKAKHRIHIQSRNETVAQTIFQWAIKKGFDAVIWSESPSNFKKETGRSFTIDRALDYLKGSPDRLYHMAPYVSRICHRVETPFSRRLLQEAWWQNAVANYQHRR